MISFACLRFSSLNEKGILALLRGAQSVRVVHDPASPLSLTCSRCPCERTVCQTACWAWWKKQRGKRQTLASLRLQVTA